MGPEFPPRMRISLRSTQHQIRILRGNTDDHYANSYVLRQRIHLPRHPGTVQLFLRARARRHHAAQARNHFLAPRRSVGPGARPLRAPCGRGSTPPSSSEPARHADRCRARGWFGGFGPFAALSFGNNGFGATRNTVRGSVQHCIWSKERSRAVLECSC